MIDDPIKVMSFGHSIRDDLPQSRPVPPGPVRPIWSGPGQGYDSMTPHDTNVSYRWGRNGLVGEKEDEQEAVRGSVTTVMEDFYIKRVHDCTYNFNISNFTHFFGRCLKSKINFASRS